MPANACDGEYPATPDVRVASFWTRRPLLTEALTSIWDGTELVERSKYIHI